MNLLEKKIGEKVFYEGTYYKYCLDKMELPNGKIVEREHIKHPGAVAVLAINDKNECIMVEQYRHAVDKILVELPGGKLDKAAGEDPKDAAQREFKEETGFLANDLIFLGEIYTMPGLVDEILYLFFTRNIQGNLKQDLDDDEFVNVRFVPISEIREKMAKGKITDSKLMSAIILAQEQGRL
jgi:ADP-ribose pyrophosphatase